jgi:hypothetical protein
VHDAATIVLTDGTRLRQVGISAPNADTCQAKQATATTDAEVRRGPLTYQLLGQADVFGNQWAYIQVSGTDLGEKLASLGWVWAYPDSPAPQTYNQRITNQVEVARTAHAGVFGTGCPATGAAPAPVAPPAPAVPPNVTVPADPAGGTSLAQMGQTISYSDGLTVSVAPAERHVTGPYASPPQFAKKRVVMVTVTVGNTGGAPLQFNPGISGPTVTYAGQEAQPVFDVNFLQFPQTTVLPGKSYTYKRLFGAAEAPGDLQVTWIREFGANPAIFTGQG